MDDRENSVGVAEVMYTVAVIAYAELMVLVIDLGHLIHTVNMNWILTPFTQCFNFVIPVLMQGANLILSNIAMNLWTLMSSWYGWLGFFLMVKFRYSVQKWLEFLMDTIFVAEKIENTLEKMDNEYPLFVYAIYCVLFVAIIAIFFCGCLKWRTTRATQNIHNTEENTTINNAGDSNVCNNTENTHVVDNRQILVNVRCRTLQLPMQLTDSQIEGNKPTRKSPRKQLFAPQTKKGRNKSPSRTTA